MLKLRYEELCVALKHPKVAENIQAEMLDQLRVYWWLADPAWKANIEIAEGHLRVKHGIPASAAGGPAGSSADSSKPTKMPKKASSGAAVGGKLDRANSLRDAVLSRF